MGGRAQKVEHRFERLKRVVQQDAAVANSFKHTTGFRQQPGVGRLKRRKLQIPPFAHVRNLHQARQIHRAIYAKQIALLQIKLLQQIRDHIVRTVLPGFQTHGVAKMPLRQLTLQRLTQVGHFFLIHEQIAVAGSTKCVAAAHFQTGEQVTDIAHQDR